MVNKVRVNIAGAPYAIATTDSEKYITSLAKKLDEDIAKLLDGNENLSVTKAAVFCAMDYLDEYKKSTGSAENMRSQIQSYIADAAHAKLAEDKAKAENETLRRENAALREQLARLKAKQDREKAAQTEQEQEKQPKFRLWWAFMLGGLVIGGAVGAIIPISINSYKRRKEDELRL